MMNELRQTKIRLDVVVAFCTVCALSYGALNFFFVSRNSYMKDCISNNRTESEYKKNLEIKLTKIDNNIETIKTLISQNQ